MLREISVDILGNEGVGDVDGVGHQKYPSCFFFSIDASPPSLSLMRPCRSLGVVSSITWIPSDSVLASLSTAPVRGYQQRFRKRTERPTRVSSGPTGKRSK